jgi:alpha-galactosidase
MMFPLLFLIGAVLAKERTGKLGKLPAMGWNTWNSLGCDNYNKTILEAVASKMISLGLKVSQYEN